MNNLISKELLSEILKIKVVELDTFSNDLHFNYFLILDHFTKRNDILNLDTLGIFCKEWCKAKKWSISSGWDIFSKRENIYIATVQNIDFKTNSFEASTELEAIIKATEWVKAQNETR
jgi:hypothetical protein